MKVKDIIQLLQKNHKPDEDLIVAYWEREAFPDVPKKDWPDFAESAMDEVDWSHAHESISFYHDIWKKD